MALSKADTSTGPAAAAAAGAGVAGDAGGAADSFAGASAAGAAGFGSAGASFGVSGADGSSPAGSAELGAGSAGLGAGSAGLGAGSLGSLTGCPAAARSSIDGGIAIPGGGGGDSEAADSSRGSVGSATGGLAHPASIPRRAIPRIAALDRQSITAAIIPTRCCRRSCFLIALVSSRSLGPLCLTASPRTPLRSGECRRSESGRLRGLYRCFPPAPGNEKGYAAMGGRPRILGVGQLERLP